VSSSGADATVAALWRYPVKSMGGEALDTAVVGTAGVVGDRAYAVVGDGLVGSAKHPRKWGRLLQMQAWYLEEPAPGAPPPPVAIRLPDGEVVRSDSPGCDRALSAALGRSVGLVTAGGERGHYEALWPDIEGLIPDEFRATVSLGTEESGDTLSRLPLAVMAPGGALVDVAPLHLMCSSTLDELRRLEPGPDFDPRRYRPNVLVDGSGSGFAENGWTGRRLCLGEVEASVSMPTMRCVMTTLAQPGLEADRRILQAAARHNRVEIAGEGTWSCVGAYAGVEVGGRLGVGDAVTVH